MKCIAFLRAGKAFCPSHDPALAAERAANGAIRRRPGDLGAELGTLDSIARRAAKILERLEDGVVLAELADKRVTARTLERLQRELGEAVALDPARANSMLAALRFLAQLVQLRTSAKKGKGSGDAGGGWGAGGLEGALG